MMLHAHLLQGAQEQRMPEGLAAPPTPTGCLPGAPLGCWVSCLAYEGEAYEDGSLGA